MYCVRCGTALPAEERFCPACGAPTSLAAPPSSEAEAKWCGACRVPVHAGQQFCWSCGAPLGDDDTVPLHGPQITRRRTFPLRYAALGLAGILILLAAGLAALMTFPPKSLAPERAEELALAALIREHDLPGGGWNLTTSSNSSDDIGLVRSIVAHPACSGLAHKANRAEIEWDFGRAGRAQRAFTRDATGQTIIPTRVETQVQVYWDTSRIEKTLGAQKDLLDDPAFSQCLADSLFGGFTGAGGAPVITVNPAEASARVPLRGITDAYTIDFAWSLDPSIEVKGSFRIEAYYWRYKNTLASVLLFGAKDEITPGLATAAVNNTQAGIERVTKK